MCLTANEENVQAVNQALTPLQQWSRPSVYYLFFKLMYFIITRCLLAGVAGGAWGGWGWEESGGGGGGGGGNVINN